MSFGNKLYFISFFPIILVTENKYIIYVISIFLFLIGVIKFIDFLQMKNTNN